ncbi:MAG: Crp/Fnr family transcriptional regulator [Bacillota bacterium]
MKIIKDKELKKHFIAKFKSDLEILDKKIKDNLELVSFDKNEYICKMEKDFDFFYFLVKGNVKVSILLENGKSFLLRIYNPLMLIGDLELSNFNEIKFSTNIKVIKDVYCLRIASKKIKKYYSENIEFVKYINHSISEKLIRVSKVSSIHLRYPLKNRLASYLFSLKNSNYFLEIESYKNLSDLLGVSYRHLQRELKNLENSGVINKKRRKIKIIDCDKLKKLSSNIY